MSAQDLPELNAGTWGGQIQYNDQETEFFLEFRTDDQNVVNGYLYLPVTNFYGISIGGVNREDSAFTAGPVQFNLEKDNKAMRGTFKSGSREFTFTLQPVGEPTLHGEPVSMESTAIPEWSYQTDGAVWGSPAADNQQIYIGSSDGNFYAISQKSGEPVWTFETGGPIFSRPLVTGGFVYILSDDGFLYKLNSENGSEIWSFDTGGEVWQRALPDDDSPGYDTMASAAAISDEIVYVGSADGHLYALDEKSGTEHWRLKTDGPVHSVPAVAEGMVYAGSYDHHVYAADAATGELRWTFDTGQVVLSSPVHANGRIFIGSRSAELFALDAATGSVDWSYFYWLSWVESSGVIFDDLLYIGSSDLQLLKAFDPADGSLLWATGLGGSPWSTPAVTETTVYTGTFGDDDYMIKHRGGFFAVDRHTGEEKWRFMMEKQPDSSIYGVVSSPVVANGFVFFGGLDGRIYAFREEGGE